MNLVPGNYRLEVEKPGFRRFAREPITVEVQSAVRIDVAMQVGELSQTAEVTAMMPLLQTENAALGQVVESHNVLERANKLQPDMPETLLELGKAQLASGDLAAAEKSFLQVLTREQMSTLAAAAHFQLSQLYRKQGRTSDADHEVEKFRKLRKPYYGPGTLLASPRRPVVDSGLQHRG